MAPQLSMFMAIVVLQQGNGVSAWSIPRFYNQDKLEVG
jgi:hypothetical protein